MNIIKVLLVITLLCISFSKEIQINPNGSPPSAVKPKRKNAMRKILRDRQLRAEGSSVMRPEIRHYSEDYYKALPYLYSAYNEDNGWAAVVAAPTAQGTNEASSKTALYTVALPNGGRAKFGNDDHPVANRNQQVANYQFDYSPVEVVTRYEELLKNNARTPITETLLERPQKPISVEQLNKAAVEPVAVFDQSSSSNDDSQDDTGKYQYQYIVEDNHWGTHFGHKEEKDGDRTNGKYQVVLPDGRIQSVQYWVDPSGYHASVSYESIADHLQVH